MALSLLLACGEDGDPDGGDDSGSSGGSTSSGGSSSGGSGSGGDGGPSSGGGDGSGGSGSGGEDGGSGGSGGSGGNGSGGDGSGGAPTFSGTCSSTIEAAETGFVELCALDEPVRHVKIEGLVAPRTHVSTQILFGADEPPENNNDPVGEGQFRVLFYGGGTPFPTPQLELDFGDANSNLSDNATFVNSLSTVCFDLHHGSSTKPPHVVLWLEGENGADCDDAETLTLESAFGRELWWGGDVTGAINTGKPILFYQGASQEAKVTLLDEPVLAEEELPPLECEQEISAAGSFVELCAIEGTARHVRIDGLVAGPTHQSAQVLFGFETAPPGSPSTLGEGQFQALFYGGGTPAPAPQFSAAFAGGGTSWVSGVDFLAAPSTVCFDVHDGSATTAPYFVLWVDGKNAADCGDRSTLTLASAFAVESFFDGKVGAIAKELPVFFRKAASQNATVRVSGVPAVSAEDIEAGRSCTTDWTANTEWQRLCTPAAGRPRHIRLEDVSAVANNSYFYLILGEPEEKAPGTTTAPSVTEGSRTFILTGGRSSGALSWTYFRLDSNATTPQYNWGLYTPNPSTICLDLGEGEGGNLSILLWATGQNSADCADRSTLTRESAVYSSVGSDVELWDAVLSDTGLNYIKTNNGNGSIGKVTLSTELAVH